MDKARIEPVILLPSGNWLDLRGIAATFVCTDGSGMTTYLHMGGTIHHDKDDKEVILDAMTKYHRGCEPKGARAW